MVGGMIYDELIAKYTKLGGMYDENKQKERRTAVRRKRMTHAAATEMDAPASVASVRSLHKDGNWRIMCTYLIF